MGAPRKLKGKLPGGESRAPRPEGRGLNPGGAQSARGSPFSCPALRKPHESQGHVSSCASASGCAHHPSPDAGPGVHPAPTAEESRGRKCQQTAASLASRA